MRFDWTNWGGQNARVTKSLISCGFLAPGTLFYADNVHALFADSREGIETLPRFPLAQYSEEKCP
jgi:hypothetical protein